MAEKQVVRLSIGGMSCAGCVAAELKNLEEEQSECEQREQAEYRWLLKQAAAVGAWVYLAITL
jgi:hypothetical protein